MKILTLEFCLGKSDYLDCIASLPLLFFFI